jgi:hypothetical protein
MEGGQCCHGGRARSFDRYTGPAVSGLKGGAGGCLSRTVGAGGLSYGAKDGAFQPVFSRVEGARILQTLPLV